MWSANLHLLCSIEEKLVRLGLYTPINDALIHYTGLRVKNQLANLARIGEIYYG